ncbi:hypothetical protein cyc_07427 [Cyclospora cayetanensis]|uniref:Uncharacterized protein n=1 Tax=Cyclospora cayetanensis TaxID=88456 RepID=A0A1D3CYN8_9EIME|nr:hypothetical protein cyc_07427 [Cyclospora cayetanensis]
MLKPRLHQRLLSSCIISVLTLVLYPTAYLTKRHQVEHSLARKKGFNSSHSLGPHLGSGPLDTSEHALELNTEHMTHGGFSRIPLEASLHDQVSNTIETGIKAHVITSPHSEPATVNQPRQAPLPLARQQPRLSHPPFSSPSSPCFVHDVPIAVQKTSDVTTAATQRSRVVSATPVGQSSAEAALPAVPLGSTLSPTFTQTGAPGSRRGGLVSVQQGAPAGSALGIAANGTFTADSAVARPLGVPQTTEVSQSFAPKYVGHYEVPKASTAPGDADYSAVGAALSVPQDVVQHNDVSTEDEDHTWIVMLVLSAVGALCLASGLMCVIACRGSEGSTETMKRVSSTLSSERNRQPRSFEHILYARDSDVRSKSMRSLTSLFSKSPRNTSTPFVPISNLQETVDAPVSTSLNR